MKYKEIFKAWWFWVLIAVNLAFEIIGHLKEFDNIFFVEIVGYFIGSFVIVLIVVSIGYGIYKIFTRNKKT